MDLNKKLEALRAEMPFMWKVQGYSGGRKHFKDTGGFKKGSWEVAPKKVICVAFIDARDAMSRLDDVFPFQWQRRHKMIGERLICEIGVKIDGEWVWREDTGTESNTEAQKGEVSDSFKRAAVNWGVGQFLYKLPKISLPAKCYGEFKKGSFQKFYPTTNNKDGEILWNGEELTAYLNKARQAAKSKNKPQPPKENTSSPPESPIPPSKEEAQKPIFNATTFKSASAQKWMKSKIGEGLDTEQLLAEIEKKYRVSSPAKELVLNFSVEEANTAA